MSKIFEGIVSEFLNGRHKEFARKKIKHILDFGNARHFLVEICKANFNFNEKATIQVWRNDKIPDELFENILLGNSYSHKVNSGDFAGCKIYLKMIMKNPLLYFDNRLFMIIEKSNPNCCIIQ
jgi:hypothetical protein